jgi:zinc transport system substrate-binding protein
MTDAPALHKDPAMFARLFLVFLIFGSTARADAPHVLTDIAPVQSLVAMVTGDVTSPDLILPPGSDGHDMALRPSDARRIEQADVVIWAGPALSPWLDPALATLAPDAQTLRLLETDGWASLPRRESFGGDAHDHDHDSGPTDPHAWMDPAIAAVWVGHIADTLATADPDNAAAYRANAATATATLTALGTEVDSLLKPHAGQPFVVGHDAYQYLETRTGLMARGAITLGDGAAPGPAHIAQVMDDLAASGARCILTDAHTNPDWITLVANGAAVTLVPADPSGAGVDQGADLYPTMIRHIATGLADCLNGG